MVSDNNRLPLRLHPAAAAAAAAASWGDGESCHRLIYHSAHPKNPTSLTTNPDMQRAVTSAVVNKPLWASARQNYNAHEPLRHLSEYIVCIRW